MAAGVMLLGTISNAGAIGASPGILPTYKPLKYRLPFSIATSNIVKLPKTSSIAADEDCWAVHPGVNPRWEGKGGGGDTLYTIDFYLAWCTPKDKSRITRWFDRNCWGHPRFEGVTFDSCNVWTGSAGYKQAPLQVDWTLHATYECGQERPCSSWYTPWVEGTVHANPPSVTGTVYFD
ncbi:MAG: hypothetical protein WAT66_08375 [Actinomycetota bacterium]